MLIERIKTDFEFIDERGSLVQLVRTGYTQVNVITSKANEIRGGHYHELNIEAFYIVSGKCEVVGKKDGEEQVEIFETGDFFRINPFVLHTFKYIEDTTLVSLYSIGVELGDGKMDMITPK